MLEGLHFIHDCWYVLGEITRQMHVIRGYKKLG